MNRWKLIFEVDVPDGMGLTPLVGAMERAAEGKGCEVQGFVERQHINPPLKVVPGGTDGD